MQVIAERSMILNRQDRRLIATTIKRMLKLTGGEGMSADARALVRRLDVPAEDRYRVTAPPPVTQPTPQLHSLYAGTGEIARRWRVSVGLVRRYAREDRIPGAVQDEYRRWLIPPTPNTPDAGLGELLAGDPAAPVESRSMRRRLRTLFGLPVDAPPEPEPELLPLPADPIEALGCVP